MRMNYGAGPEGVPNPLTFIVHPYPTRYHGPIYTRPMWNAEFATQPYTFQAGPDGSMSGLGQPTLEEFTESVTEAGQAAAAQLCEPLCKKQNYAWGAYGLVAGGAIAWLVWRKQ